MSGLEIVVAIVIAIGLVGVIVPVLPGDGLILAAVLVWAVGTGGSTAWTWAVIAAALLVVGAVTKYAVPGRRLQRDGIGTTTLVVAGLAGLIGFFVIPVIGLPLGFVAGVYAMQWHARGQEQAWPATKAALRAVGLAMLIEMTFALLATGAWVVGVLST